MAEFPDDIYTPRETENLPGIVYDANDKRNMYSEDFQNLGGEINAIEETLGTNPEGAFATVKAWLEDLSSAISTIFSAIPTGGTTGQVLKKTSDDDYDTEWGTGGGGSGDVTKVGTPVNNELGIWTGDGTIEGDPALTFDTSNNTLGIGTTSEGGNQNVVATLGSELAPALTNGNWTVGSGWESPIVGPGLIKNADGVGTQTPSASTTIVAGTIYKVVITLSAWTVGSGSYTLGGIKGNNSLASAGTYTEYILAFTTDKLVITPTNTARFTISSISIKALTDATGDLIVDGNLNVRSQAYFNSRVAIGTTVHTGIMDVVAPQGENPPVFTRIRSSGGIQSSLQLGLRDNPTSAGDGTSFLFFLSNSAGVKSFTGRLSSIWEDGTAGSEKASTAINVRASTADVNATTEVARWLSNGNMGIGLTVPTARVHIKAGTATAGTAPLKFDTGTVNTTPEAGSMEYNNTPHFTNSDGTRRNIVLATNATKTTAGAPYTNDGYITIRIGGTDVKVMTTA